MLLLFAASCVRSNRRTTEASVVRRGMKPGIFLYITRCVRFSRPAYCEFRLSKKRRYCERSPIENVGESGMRCPVGCRKSSSPNVHARRVSMKLLTSAPGGAIPTARAPAVPSTSYPGLVARSGGGAGIPGGPGSDGETALGGGAAAGEAGASETAWVAGVPEAPAEGGGRGRAAPGATTTCTGGAGGGAAGGGASGLRLRGSGRLLCARKLRAERGEREREQTNGGEDELSSASWFLFRKGRRGGPRQYDPELVSRIVRACTHAVSEGTARRPSATTSSWQRAWIVYWEPPEK